MADIVKELFKGEVLYGNYVDGKQTLYSTDGTKTAVIKDVQIGTNEYTTAPSLQVGDFTVATLSGTASGSEIVGTNSTIKIKNNDTTQYSISSVSYVNGLNTTTRYYQATTPASFFAPTSTPASITQGGSTVLSAFSNAPSLEFVYPFPSVSRFVYQYTDGNSTWRLFKQTSGSNSTINSDSYAPACFDGVSKFYWVSPSYGTIRCYDALTDSTTDIVNYSSIDFNSGSSYPRITFCNGIIFWNYTSGATVKWYKISNGTWGTVGGSGWSNSNVYQSCIMYDATLNTYKWLVAGSSGVTSTWFYYEFSANQNQDTFTFINTGSITPSSSGCKLQPQNSTGSLTAFGSGSSSTTIYTVRYSDMLLTPIATVTGANFDSYTHGKITTTAATTEQLNTNGAKISLRITGVESTL